MNVGDLCATLAQSLAASGFDELAGSLAVVKAQLHAGGRGKGTILEHPEQRGVQLVQSAGEAAEVAARMLGQTLVTIQTGPAGRRVRPDGRLAATFDRIEAEIAAIVADAHTFALNSPYPEASTAATHVYSV